MKQTAPKSIELQALAALLEGKQPVKVLLAEPAKWITWESALELQMRDVHVHRVCPDEKFPIYVSMSEDPDEAVSIPYEEKMKFIIRLG